MTTSAVTTSGMTRRRRRATCGTLALLLLLAPHGAAETAPDTQPAAAGAPPLVDTRPPALREVAIEQRLDAQVPLDLAFRDESGAPVNLGQYFGTRPVILSLVYYQCPMLCTLVLNGLVRALRVLSFDPGREFEIVTVSFNPRETPELAATKKATYLGEYDRPGAAAGWHFLTGDADAIERLARAVGFHYTYVPEEQQFAHAAAIMVLTQDGRVARYFFGVEYSPRDLRFGLIDAAEHKIGTAVDHLLLYCYRYDPATGKYGAIAMNLVRAGGLVTVLALVGFVLMMRRHETCRHERRVVGRS
ncbi:MAG: SCO family protein [Deltaproteobacteria bacterium]|nr:SCO family protein [Deltaproteobacteria bacterium]